MLGDPDKKLRFVHVAGTNGKGSACAMLSSVLMASGYRTGLYTSPYIRRFNERMQINGVDIPDAELARLTERIIPLVEKTDDPPSQFEVITAIAMQWFLEKGCDVVVLEVGLGGEDYELLFSIRQEDYQKFQSIPGPEIYAIGYVCEKDKGRRLITTSGDEAELQAQGWRFFTN